MQSYLIHPGYNPAVLGENDIAMLRLRYPVKATPATLATALPADGTALTIVGWGVIEGNKNPTELK